MYWEEFLKKHASNGSAAVRHSDMYEQRLISAPPDDYDYHIDSKILQSSHNLLQIQPSNARLISEE